jgi:hypothetical protein
LPRVGMRNWLTYWRKLRPLTAGPPRMERRCDRSAAHRRTSWCSNGHAGHFD